MENFITQTVKFLSSTVIVHIYSFPHFAIETLLAFIVCTIHILLINEVNYVYRRTNAKAAAKLRLRQYSIKELEPCSYHSIAKVETLVFPDMFESIAHRQHSYMIPPSPYKRLGRRTSNTSHFGWVISRNISSVYGGTYSDRIEQLLAVSPSEYVRKDKERKYREAGLKNCIHSLTCLLEKALDAGENGFTLDQLSKEALKSSIKTIKSDFEKNLSGLRDPISKVASCRSIYSLISQTMTKSTLLNALSPELNPDNTAEERRTEEGFKSDESQDGKKSLVGSLSELFEDRIPQKDNLMEAKAPIAICNA
ncbi:unnamed protein product [Acanthoscelides obtectus]|uniref:Uncharacterized protein n=1 Tax=Acanthoscelides obtectus TaxID=200917 RepID=A0A9P0JXB4_ACAOB|nr:unnamed protein product [Acanthoscelides obtectus]CAK1638075.1 hypothetical protein AOBTE_LOCUS10374 [Acanthoscelides obtectus]